MSLLHFFHYNPYIPVGVLKKVGRKATILKELGEAQTFILSRPEHFDSHFFVNEQKWQTYDDTYHDALARLALEHPRAALYGRFPGPDQRLTELVEKHPRRFVFEHNTIHWAEHLCQLQDYTWRDWAYIVTRTPSRLWSGVASPFVNEWRELPRILKACLGSASVGQAIRSHLNTRAPGHPVFIAGNGIDFDEVAPRESYPPLGENIRILFVSGCWSAWTGEDRLLRGLLNYQGLHEFHIEFVGHYKPATKLLASQLSGRTTTIFHGVKSLVEIREMASQAHVGAGSLAVFRKKQFDQASLKVRHYMALGLPFFLGYSDVDLPYDYPYALEYSSDDTPLEMTRLVNFLGTIYESEFRPEVMSKQSRPLVDMRSKLQKLVDFVEFYQASDHFR